jgi:hypothetical protein
MFLRIWTARGIKEINDEAIAGMEIETGMGWAPRGGVPQVEEKLNKFR